jgi:sec-independent protein translocase protein TatB
MLDIGWSELMVIGALALIVVGPKDLPKLLRSFGQYVAQMRGMARDFQRSMEDAAREADISDMKEMRDAAKQLRDLKKLPFETIGQPKPTRTSASAAPKPAASKPVAASAGAAGVTAPPATASAAAPPATAPAAPQPPAAAPTGGEGA